VNDFAFSEEKWEAIQARATKAETMRSVSPFLASGKSDKLDP
jgi:hypothetical protein